MRHGPATNVSERVCNGCAMVGSKEEMIFCDVCRRWYCEGCHKWHVTGCEEKA